MRLPLQKTYETTIAAYCISILSLVSPHAFVDHEKLTTTAVNACLAFISLTGGRKRVGKLRILLHNTINEATTPPCNTQQYICTPACSVVVQQERFPPLHSSDNINFACHPSSVYTHYTLTHHIHPVVYNDVPPSRAMAA